MRPAVKAAWLAFSEPLEGCVPYLYADVLGLVTTAVGCLVDPVSYAVALPWTIEGRPALSNEVAAQWWRVKNDPKCARLGHLYAKTLTTARLTPQGIERVVGHKLDANDATLRLRFPDMEDWPACAQMATHSLAWACGPSFHFPKLASALLARDFDAAAVHGHINEWNGTVHNTGVIPRNTANRILWMNAARVDAYRLDPDMLEWKVLLGVSAAETLRELPDLGDDEDLPVLNTPIMEHPASSPTLFYDSLSEAERLKPKG